MKTHAEADPGKTARAAVERIEALPEKGMASPASGQLFALSAPGDAIRRPNQGIDLRGPPQAATMLRMQRLVGNYRTARMAGAAAPSPAARPQIEAAGTRAEPEVPRAAALVPAPPLAPPPAPPASTAGVSRKTVQRDDDDWDILGGIRSRINALVDGLRSGWESVSTLATDAFSGLTDSLSSATDSLSSVVGGVVATAQTGWAEATATVTDMAQGVRDQLGGLVGNITSAGAAVRAGVMRMDADAIGNAWATLQALVGGVWSGLQQAQAALFERVGSLWEGIASGFGAAWDAANAQFTALYEGLAEQVGAVAGRVRGAWDSVREQAAELGGIVGEAAEIIQAAVNQLMSWAQDIWDDIRAQWGALSERLDGLLSSAREQVNEVWDTMSDLANGAWEAIESGWSALTEAVSEQMSELAGGVQDIWERITYQSIDGVVDKVGKYSKLVRATERALDDPDGVLEEVSGPIAAQLQAGMPAQAVQAGQEKMAEASGQIPAASGGTMTVFRSPDIRVQRQERSVTPPGLLWDGFVEALGTKWEELDVWKLVKDVVKTLIWPWPTVGKELSALWEDWTNAAGDLFAMRSLLDDPLGALHDLWSNVLALLDFPLALWRRINNIVLALMGWITVALMILGAIGGTVAGAIFGAIAGALTTLGIATAPGAAGGAAAGGLEGAGAGFGVALAIGELFVYSFALAEGASLVKMLVDLLTARQTSAQKERDFNQAADSFIGLGILAVLLALAWFAGRVAAAVAPLLKKVPLPRGLVSAAEEFGEGMRSTRPREGAPEGEMDPIPEGEKPLSTGAKEGQPPTEQTIREGSVRMEEHPQYAETIAEIERAGFEVQETTGDPHVSIREVVDAEGNVLRTERVLRVQRNMRFLDLEHELGHVRQMVDRFGEHPPPTERVVETPEGASRSARDQAGILTNWQNAIVEFHNRLVEFLRLSERGASPELLREHARGVATWREIYLDKGIKGGRSPSRLAWANEHFPDLGSLQQRYTQSGGRALE